MRSLGRMTAMALLVAVATTMAHAAAKPDAGALKVYFADVEGGQATLFVTPQGESLLVDTGWPGFGGRDADRIVALARQAGLSKLDNVLITHYHADHIGGVGQLARKIPIGRFIDHGDNTETGVPGAAELSELYRTTLSTSHAVRLTVKPGDVLPITGMKVEIVSSNGDLIAKPIQGGGAGGQNPYCDKTPLRDEEKSENDRSLGMMITFGKVRILDLGDLTWAKERPLMCPIDKLGKVDVYIVSHHGMDRSGSELLVDAVAPRTAIMDNGPKKGGSQPAWTVVQASPRIAGGKGDLWQLHTSEESDAAHNVPDARIANLPGPDAGHSLTLIARKDGSFTVTNERTGETAKYGAQ